MMRLISLTLLLTFTSLVAISPAAERDARWAVKVEQAGLPNLHRVTADIYRCAQPTAEGLLAAEKLGIKTVISLRAFHTIFSN